MLTFIGHYLPGYLSGGPIRSIANMVDHLWEDLEFRIVTMDRDANDESSFEGVPLNAWTPVGGAEVYYCSGPDTTQAQCIRLIRETPHDVIYLNGFFDTRFTLRVLAARRLGQLIGRPIVLAPRGEFSKGAISLRSWKKIPFLWAAKVLGLYKSITWHASSPGEAADIRRVLGRTAVDVQVAPNMPRRNQAAALGRPCRGDGALKLIFLSRLDVKKNLDFALRVLAQVRVPITYDIYGPKWDEPYWKKCTEIIETLPPHIVARYCGIVHPTMVATTMAKYDLFFFPTRGENFGHVIMEALASGTPVLISDQTPWSDDGNRGCVVRSLATLGPFARVIEDFSNMAPSDLAATRVAAQSIAQKFVDGEELAARNLRIFRQAIG